MEQLFWFFKDIEGISEFGEEGVIDVREVVAITSRQNLKVEDYHTVRILLKNGERIHTYQTTANLTELKEKFTQWKEWKQAT